MGSGLSSDESSGRPSAQQIREQLARVLGARDFAEYPRSAALLSHVVRETLDGRGGEIKESTLGVDVFGREPGYDSKADSVVRTQARRVREKLSQYYSSVGQADAVVIEIPKGGYVPEFRLAPAMEQTVAAPPRRGFKIAWAAALVGIAVGGVAIGMRRQTESAPRFPTLAVLPFVDLDAGHRFDALAYGMAEDVERDLSRVQALRLHAGPRGVSGAERSDYRELSRRLAVDTLLEGQIATEGNRGEIRVSLIRAADNSILWTDHFPSDAPIGGMERQIEENVARALHVKLAAGPSRPENAKAHDLFFAGRTLWATRDPVKTREAIELFGQAAKLDPNYGLAYMGIADAYGLMMANGQIDSKTGIERGAAAAHRALELDPSLAEAYAALGLIEAAQWRWRDAAAEYQRAIDLNPSYDRAYERAGVNRYILGDFAEAERLVRESERLNPYAMSLPLVRAEVYYYWRHYPEAVDLIRQVQKAEPDNPTAYQLLARVRFEQHQWDKALEAGRAAAAEYPKTLLFQSELAPYLLAAGHAEEARKLVSQVLRANVNGELNPYTLAMMYARMGDKEKTLDLLEQALEMHVPDLPTVRWEPPLDLVRKDARYQAIVARIYGSAK